MTHRMADIHLIAGRRQPIPLPRRSGLPTKLLARVRGASLDRALADGADPASSGILAQRAASLTSARSRHALARSTHRLLDQTVGAVGLSSAIPPHRGALADARLPLARVAALLDETAEPVYSQGVAMIRLLLTNGDGPLYSPRRQGELRRHAEAIVEALEGREDTWS